MTQQFSSKPMTYGPMIVTPSPLVSGEIGIPYSQSLNASGGQAPYTWSITSGLLPAGLSLLPAGVIFGTPTALFSGVFTLGLVDANGSPTAKAFGMTVVSQLQITTSSIPTGTQGTLYSYPMAASGGAGNDRWSIASQSGTYNTYAIDPVSGVLSTPAANVGSDTLVIKVVDALGAPATGNFTGSIISSFTGLNYVGACASGLSYADVAQPFLNLFKGSGTLVLFSSWNTTVGTSGASTGEEQYLQFDANGYVTSLTALGEGSQTFTAVGTGINISLGTAPGASGPYPAGPYTFQCQGAGTMVFGADVSGLSNPSSGISVSGTAPWTVTSTLAPGQTGTCTVAVAAPSGGIRFWVTSISTP